MLFYIISLIIYYLYISFYFNSCYLFSFYFTYFILLVLLYILWLLFSFISFWLTGSFSYIFCLNSISILLGYRSLCRLQVVGSKWLSFAILLISIWQFSFILFFLTTFLISRRAGVCIWLKPRLCHIPWCILYDDKDSRKFLLDTSGVRRVVFPYTVKGVPYSCPIIIARFLLVSAVMVLFL